MARIARVVAARFPHHVTQRGNRRMRTFFGDGDYSAYIELLTFTASRVTYLPEKRATVYRRVSAHHANGTGVGLGREGELDE